MKRKLVSMLVALLVVAMLVPAIACAEKVNLAYGSGALNIRSGPGTSYKSVGTVHDGDSISVVETGSVWSKIKTSSGKTGYIKNLYINDGDTDYAAGTSYFGTKYSAYITSAVNFRAGASTSTASMGTLAKGAKVTVLGKNGGFYLISNSKGTQGYVSAKYISTDKVPSSGSGSSSTKTKTVTASFVNVRAGGGLSYKVVKVLPKGTKVTVLKVGNYWTQISYKSTKGWIKNTYLK